MPPANETLRLAIRHHRSGDLRQAEQLYLQVLEQEPDHADAHHLLGMVALVQGQATRAVDHLQRAVRGNRQSADFRHHLGVALSAAGRKEQAVEALQDAHAQWPQSAPICNDLADVLRDLGQAAEAEAFYRKAIELDPQLVEAHNNLGNLLRGLKRWDAALTALRAAALVRPRAFEVHFNLGTCYCDQARWSEAVTAFRQAITIQGNLPIVHRGLGVALLGLKEYQAAVVSYQEALRLDPQYVDALVGLGAARQGLHRIADAKACYLRALALKPADPTALYNLGVAEIADGNYPQAEQLFQSVIAAVPEYVEGHFRLGQSTRHQGKFAEAIAAYQAAIGLNPQHAESHYHLGEVYLAQGQLIKGWDEYGWRLKAPHCTRPCPEPLPPDTNLAGKRVLVAAEGGLGDTLQFIRYVPLLIERGAEVAIEAQGGLVPLLEQSGYSQVVAVGRLRPFEPDWEVPMLSLPRAFATSLDTIPRKVPYLSVGDEVVEKWRGRLRSTAGFKVGIHWHGSRSWTSDPRSMPLSVFEPLARIRGVRLLSLQREDDLGELQAARERFEIVDFGEELDASGAFIDTAALMKLVDLVITCDTATAHLAGGLGVRTWLALARFPDWRWLLDRSDCPWYPTMQLFRQSQANDWGSVMRNMAEELARIA
jgi:tetratricopeptide (TPR) repeat protein